MAANIVLLRPALFGVLALMMPALLTAADHKACKLLTAAELEPVVGGKLSAFKAYRVGAADICAASSGMAGVILRLEKKTDPGPSTANRVAELLERLRKAGATVEVKTLGPITCHTMLPSKSMQIHGFDTFCMVSKGNAVASVQTTAWTEKDVVPIDKLHPLAEKMAGRF